MIRICPCCDQVLPETNAEKGIAKAKAGIAKSKRDEARAAWESYSSAHPASGFLGQYPEIGMVLSLVAMIALFITLVPQLLELAGFLKAVLGSLSVGSLIFYLTSYVPTRKISAHQVSLRNAFILRHKEQAGVLGFEVSWR